jgi:hypothetical protein
MSHGLQPRLSVAMVMMRRHMLDKAALKSVYFSFDKLKQINALLIVTGKTDLLEP